jgi:glycerol-3-phosphate dehydrogenase (NAD(P)+)
VKIGILGAGSWAIALAVLLRRRGHAICMWEFNPADAEMLRTKREHSTKLPGIRLPDDVEIVNDISVTAAHAEMLVCAVPAQKMRSAMKALSRSVKTEVLDRIGGWVIVAKGIECGTLKLMADVLIEEIPGLGMDRIVVLSGPSHAEEVSRNIPTTIVAASENNELARAVQAQFSNETFRIYTNDDVMGVELAGSTKNVIALAAGICDGMGLGDNTKGALLTRGIAEMMRLGKRMGARESTFSGLAGIGDLITTCISRHSRNRNLGEMIASGLTLDQALSRMTMVAEGVETARSVYELSNRLSIEMPITTEVYKTLFENKPAKVAVRDLMVRESKPEWY